MDQVDAIVVGAGVVGLAIAARLSETYSNLLIIDQHAVFGEETSSRNSEVIHAGIYYPQNSLKAQLCVRGKALLYEYCRQKHIPHRALGKLIVATNSSELDGLENTRQQAQQNGVTDLEFQSATQLKALAPALNAVEALLSPSTGIVDSHSLMQSLLADIETHGGMFVGCTEFVRAEKNGQSFQVTLNSQGETLTLKSPILINSGGLAAQAVAKNIQGLSAELIPPLYLCKGHYFAYAGKSPFSQLIYPLPEKSGAGLGIHATLDMGAQLRFGPDTEYLNTTQFNPTEDYQFSADSLPALKTKFVSAIHRYWPSMNPDKLTPAYTGIRPKLQGPDDPVQDFMIQNGAEFGLTGLINLYGIESPGLTSALAIAEQIATALR